MKRKWLTLFCCLTVCITGCSSPSKDTAPPAQTADTAVNNSDTDTETEKALTLDDIADDKAALLASAHSYISGQLELPFYTKDLLCSLEEAQALIDSKILTDDNWHFTKTGLTFLADETILPTESGSTLSFAVPYQQLEGLKPEYQYTGAFELAAPAGSTISADMNADESIDAVYFDTCFDYETGVLDSTLTINGTDYSYMLQSEDCFLTIGASHDARLDYYLIDLDIEDNYIELAIQDSGESYDYMTYFFRFDGRDLLYLGSVSDLLSHSSCQTYGNGQITASERINLLETVKAAVTYQLDGDLLMPVVEDWYYLLTEDIPDEFQHPVILADVTVYTKNSRHSEAVTLTPADGSVTFLATDNEHWIMLRDAANQLYYLYLEDYSTLEDGRSTMDVFDGLLLAD